MRVCVSLSIIFIFFPLYRSRKRTVAAYYILYVHILKNGCTQGNERFPSFLPPSDSSYFLILNFQSRNRFANIFISEKGYNNGMGGEIVMKKEPCRSLRAEQIGVKWIGLEVEAIDPSCALFGRPFGA